MITACWLGLVSGLGETALFAAAKYGLGRLVQTNPQVAWMAPVGYAVLFTALGVLFTLLLRRHPSAVLRATSGAALFAGSMGALFMIQSLHKVAAAALAAGLAFQGSGLIVRHATTFHRIVRATSGPLICLVFAVGAGLNAASAFMDRQADASVATRPAPASDAPNVLLIVWDTVRAANLSLYGYERRTVPALERLASHGTVFDRAFSTAPWTLPSHASMFTGLLPRDLSADWAHPLDDGPYAPRTVAEVFRDRGYRTGGFTANVLYTSRESGLSRGFIRYRDYPVLSAGYFVAGTSLVRTFLTTAACRRAVGVKDGLGRRSAADVNAEFLEWVGEGGNRPFFAFINCFDAHAPYLPPPPFDTEFGPLLPGRWPWKTEGVALSPRELRAEVDAYDGAIAYADHELNLLLAQMDRRGILKNTLVIVTSDHGEEFGEHSVFTHGNSLYDEALHVPLVMSLPGRVPEGRRVTTWVSMRDLAATIFDVVLRDDATTLPGRSLSRHWAEGVPAAPAETLISSVSLSIGHPRFYPVAKGDMTAVMADPFKYIRNGDGKEELYDLRRDPSEAHDLSGEAPPEVLDRLRATAGER